MGGNDDGIREDAGFFSGGESYLLILYFLLFLFLFCLLCYGVCCGIPGLFGRFCFATERRRCGIFGCAFDLAAYRREQESLRRLRELRRLRMEELRAAVVGGPPGTTGGLDPAVVRAMNSTPNNIALFASGNSPPPFYGSGAMGGSTNVSPWSPNADLELRRLAFADANRPFGNAMSMWAAYQQMNNLGIIVLPDTRDGRGLEGGEVHIRETLSSEERRKILESILDFRPFHVKGNCDEAERDGRNGDDTTHEPFENEPCGSSQKVDDSGAAAEIIISADESKVEGEKDADSLSSGTSEVDHDPAQSTASQSMASQSMPSAMDSVGMPKLAESSCAICLDEFEEGELLNNSTGECSHIFHKDCLIMWLEEHDGCPTCRRTMVTDSAWREAHAVAINEEVATGGADEAAEASEGPASASPQGDRSSPRGSDMVDVELG